MSRAQRREDRTVKMKKVGTTEEGETVVDGVKVERITLELDSEREGDECV